MKHVEKTIYIKDNKYDEIYSDVEWAWDMAHCFIEEYDIPNTGKEQIEITKIMLSQLNVYAKNCTEEDING